MFPRDINKESWPRSIPRRRKFSVDLKKKKKKKIRRSISSFNLFEKKENEVYLRDFYTLFNPPRSNRIFLSFEAEPSSN